MSVSPLVQTTVTLVQHDFRGFVLTNRALMLGFLSRCSNKDTLKKYYFTYNEEIEKIWNEKHAQRLELARKTKGAYRTVLQEEDACLDDEMIKRYGKRYYGPIRLKTDDLRFTQKRFLEVFFHTQNVTKEEKESLTRKIAEADDFTLIIENLTKEGADGLKTGRSPLEPFAEELQWFITKRAHEILGAQNGDLSQQIERLKKLDSSERQVVLMQSFSTTFAHMQHVAACLAQIQRIALPQTVPVEEEDSLRVSCPDFVRDQFEESKRRYYSILEKGIARQLQIPVNSEPEAIELIANSFFEVEVLALRNSLSNFRTMLTVMLESNFSPRDKAQAKKIQKKRDHHSLQEALRSPSPLLSPVLQSPRQSLALQSPTLQSPLASQSSSALPSPRAAPSSPGSDMSDTKFVLTGAIRALKEPPTISSSLPDSDMSDAKSVPAHATPAPKVPPASSSSLAEPVSTPTKPAQKLPPLSRSHSFLKASDQSQAKQPLLARKTDTLKGHSSLARSHSTGGEKSSPLAQLMSSFRKVVLSAPEDEITPEEEQKAEECLRIEAYHDIFSISLEVLDTLRHSYETFKKQSPRI